MKEFRRMWKQRGMPALVLLSALWMAAVLLPFPGEELLPGIRPALALPVPLGLFFGPAGALGAGLGALGAGLFQGMGWESLVRFLEFFLLAFIPYRVWHYLGICPPGDPCLSPSKAGESLLSFALSALTGALGAALALTFSSQALPWEEVVRNGGSALLMSLLPGSLLYFLAIRPLAAIGLLWQPAAEEPRPAPSLRFWRWAFILSPPLGLVLVLLFNLGIWGSAAALSILLLSGLLSE